MEDVTDKNIQAVYQRELKETKEAPASQKVARQIARFSGTVWFILFHIVFFVAWILFNTFSDSAFDKYPFTFLTMTVSLEAIFLSGFVMLSQNELSKQADKRNSLDLHINLLAEQENTEVIKFLIRMGKKIGMKEADWQGLEPFSKDVTPDQLLEKISKIEKK